MQFRPVIAKSQQFLNQHERETLLVSRCVIGLLTLSLFVVLGFMLFQLIFAS